MGAHSGSSSDDLFFISGIGGEYFKIFYSWNQERHGIKHMENEETKFEKAISLYYNLSRTNYFFLKFELEKIENFNFYENNISYSCYAWLGYSFKISDKRSR